MPMRYILKVYKTPAGKEPFTEWLRSLKDKTIKYRIVTRLDRLETGSLGDYKNLGDGINELRMQFGAGYRVYFAIIGKQLIILLHGGDKASQRNDIKLAKQYLKEIEKGLNHEKF